MKKLQLLTTISLQRFSSSTNKYLKIKKMITDSKPNTFGYPTQILIRSELGLQYLLNPSNDLRVIYYDYQVLNTKAGQLYLVKDI